MKKRERIYRWTAALTAALTAASILTVPAFAETSVGADSAVALPMAKHEDGLDFATVWEMSLNTAKNAELQKEQLHELLEKRFGVEDETELTFSEPYYWYYNFNEFAADEDLYTYFVFQDGELLGEISLLSNGDYLSASTIPADSVLRTLVENGRWCRIWSMPMGRSMMCREMPQQIMCWEKCRIILTALRRKIPPKQQRRPNRQQMSAQWVM